MIPPASMIPLGVCPSAECKIVTQLHRGSGRKNRITITSRGRICTKRGVLVPISREDTADIDRIPRVSQDMNIAVEYFHKLFEGRGIERCTLRRLCTEHHAVRLKPGAPASPGLERETAQMKVQKERRERKGKIR